MKFLEILLFHKLLAESISCEDNSTIKRTVASTPPIARPVTDDIEIALDEIALDTALLALALDTETATLIDISLLNVVFSIYSFLRIPLLSSSSFKQITMI